MDHQVGRGGAKGAAIASAPRAEVGVPLWGGHELFGGSDQMALVVGLEAGGPGEAGTFQAESIGLTGSCTRRLRRVSTLGRQLFTLPQYRRQLTETHSVFDSGRDSVWLLADAGKGKPFVAAGWMCSLGRDCRLGTMAFVA